MPKNNLDQLKQIDVLALRKKVVDAKKELSNLILDKNTAKLKDLRAISKKRKEIARALTILNQKILLEKLELNLEEKKEAAK